MACRQSTHVLKFRTCQASKVRIPDGHKITKSHSSEISIHRKAIYPTFQKPEVLFPRIVITPTYRSPESPKSRTVPEVSLLRIFIPRFISHGRHTHKGDSQRYALDFKHEVSCVWRAEQDSYGKIHPRKSEKSVIPDINSKMALNVHRSSSKKMLSNFVNITFSFLISSCFPPRAFLVMQRCQVLQLDSVEWHLHCLLSLSLSLFVLWENFQSNLWRRLASITENALFCVETNVTLNIIFSKSV